MGNKKMTPVGKLIACFIVGGMGTLSLSIAIIPYIYYVIYYDMWETERIRAILFGVLYIWVVLSILVNMIYDIMNRKDNNDG